MKSYLKRFLEFDERCRYCAVPVAINLMLFIVLAIILLLSGCKSTPPVAKQSLTAPPLPPGVQKPLAVSRAAPAVVGPPAPHIVAVPVPQTFSDMMGTNLWHPFIYIQASTNLVNWWTVQAVPLGETPETLYLTNTSPHGFLRAGF